MTTATTSPLPNRNQEETLIDYYPVDWDYGHLAVNRICQDGSREIIGYIYTEIDGEESRYISTDPKGKELFKATTDFSTVSRRFEWLAHRIALDKEPTRLQIQTNNYSPSKNPTTMKTTSKNPEQPKTKFNQLIFTEYEKATKDGHFITVGDSYKNTIGRIHKSFNEETRKFEYTSFDHAGNPMGKSEKLWELKNEFTSNRDQLLEQAHQRRIESKAQAKQTPEEAQPAKAELKPEAKHEARATEKEAGTPEKENAQAVENKTRQEEREEELEDLRSEMEDEDRGDMDIAF